MPLKEEMIKGLDALEDLIKGWPNIYFWKRDVGRIYEVSL